MEYVVITPARNEARFIELTLRSMVAQTARPMKWVVVSDGSTDGTDDIVKRYEAEHSWIELARTPERKERDFAGKVRAFNTGLARVTGLNYDAICCLDGDVSFEPEYFAFLLQKMENDPKLGLVGTPFRENSQQAYDYRFVSIEHVSGICQLFRRACFEDVGGYVPVKTGSIDHIAVLTARMKGWKTRTFAEMSCDHHRQIGTASQGALKARFKYGIKDYLMGNHPLWELFRSVYQMIRKPYVVGGLAVLFGYLTGAVRGMKRPISQDLVAFSRREQMQRLKRFFTGGRVSREYV